MKDLRDKHNMIITEDLIPSSAFRSSLFAQSVPSLRDHCTSFPEAKHSYRKRQVVLDFLVTFWDVLCSTLSLDWHTLSPWFLGVFFFFPFWKQWLVFLTPGPCSAWSHSGAFCEWEDADPLVVSLLTSNTHQFLLFELQRKHHAHLGCQWQLFTPLKNLSPLSGIWYFLSLHSKNMMNILGLWLPGGRSEAPS